MEEYSGDFKVIVSELQVLLDLVETSKSLQVIGCTPALLTSIMRK